MIQSLFVQNKTLTQLQSGPLGPYLDGLAVALRNEDYADSIIRRYLRRGYLFGYWIAERNIPLNTIDETTVTLYISGFQRLEHRTRPNGRLPDRAIGLRKLLAILRQQGIVALPSEQSPATETERWLSKFNNHLNHAVGLADGTRRNYLRYAAALMQARFGTTMPDWGKLCVDDVVGFVREQAAKLNGSSRHSPVTATRIFLRFLAVKGVIHSGLADIVPSVREYKLASLPNYLTTDELNQVIASCDETTSLGQRDKAIITLLSRLGLRAVEVAHLRIDDIDWHSGCVLIKASKSHRERSLPLPQDGGDILVTYLRGMDGL